MFEFIRSHQRLMQLVLLILIVPSFALFGLESYTRMGDRDSEVATVAGQPITSQQVDEAHRQQVERLRQMFGGQIDSRMFDTPEARQSVLDGLIAQRSLIAEVVRSGISVPDQVLQQEILAIPDLVSADGKFDVERYKSLLAAQGMTPQMYEAGLRRDLAQQQLTGAIRDSVIAPKILTGWLTEISEQERHVQAMRFAAKDYRSQAKVTDEMLNDFYKNNPAAFQVPEQVNAEYVVLDMNAAMAQVSVSDADVSSYFEQNRKRYATQEQRRASHILILANASASAADRAAAREKANQLVQQLRKNPADFEKLAKENSQDPGSAERGGDLGLFAKGTMVKPFEDAAFSLKPGEISDPVESEYGYHIIKVTEIKPGEERTLEQVKDEIVDDIRKQLASRKFSEMAETFSNTVYEQSESLKPVAEKLGLKIRTVDGLTRAGDPKNKQSPLNNPNFLNAIFGDDAVRNKRNTEAVEAGQNVLISGRVVDHKPASVKPFDEVKAAIADEVRRREAQALARKAGEEKLAELKANPSAAGFGETKVVSRSSNADFRGEAATAILKADVARLPVFVGAELPGEGYGVYRIVKVSQPANPDQQKRAAQQQQVAELLAQQQMNAYIESLKKKAKVKIKAPIAPRNTETG